LVYGIVGIINDPVVLNEKEEKINFNKIRETMDSWIKMLLNDSNPT